MSERDEVRLQGQGEIVRRSVLLGVLVAISRLCAFLAMLKAARHFGADEFGAMGLSQQVASYAVYAAGCGLEVYGVKLGAERERGIGSLASTIVLLRLSLGVVAYAAVLATAFIVPEWRAILPMMAWFSLSVFTAAISTAWVAQAVQRTLVFALAQLAAQALYLGLVHGAIFYGLQSWSVGMSLVLGEALTAAGLWVWMRSRITPFGRPARPKEAWHLLKRAAPIGASQVGRVLAVGSDLVLLGSLATLEETGWYGGAYRLYVFALSLLAIYFVVLFPHIVRRAAEEPHALRRETVQSLRRTGIPCSLLLLVGGWIAPDLLEALFDASFGAAGTAFRILLVVVLVALANAHLRQALLVLGRQKADMHNVTISAIVHVAAKLVLIPVWGMAGAASGTLLGELVLLGLTRASLRW